MHQAGSPAVENRAALERGSERRQRIQMALLRESWMSQPAIAEAILLSRSGPARPMKSSHGVRARYNARILK